jgi:acyl carrier protein
MRGEKKQQGSGEKEKVSREEVIQLIMEVIREIVPNEDLSDVDPDVPLRDQIELDSVDFLNIVMELQMRYQLEIPEDEFIELTTLNRCAAYLGPKLEPRAF